MGGPDKVEETSQQRAQAEFAQNTYRDWKARWLPVQRQLMRSIQAEGQVGSAQQKLAEGKASTDTAIQFSDAAKKLENQVTNSGVGISSPKGVMALSGMSDDAATSTVGGLTIADQQIKDAYMEGLSALTKTGQGEHAQVGDALGIQASQSARQAATDAEMSLANRAGTARVAGQVAGFGLQRMGGSPGIPSFNGTNDIQGITGTNATDRFMQFGVGGD